MRHHRAGAQAFVFGHGNGLQMADNIFADAENNILGNAGKMPGLDDVKNDGDNPQQQTDDQNNRNIKHRQMPCAWKQRIDDRHSRARLFEQHFIDQQRHQQRHRNAGDSRQDGDNVGINQGFFML